MCETHPPKAKKAGCFVMFMVNITRMIIKFIIMSMIIMITNKP